MRNVYKLLTACILLLVAALTVQAQPAPINELYRQTSEVHNLMTQYAADRGSLNRFYVVANSPERRERLQRHTTETLQKLQALNFDRMPVDSQVDYLLFRRTLEVDLREFQTEAVEVAKTQAWFPFADPIYALEKVRRRGAALNGETIAADFAKLSREVADALKTVQKLDKVDPVLAQRAEDTANGLKSALKSVFEFYNEYDPLFTWWVPEPYKKLDGQLSEYAAFFGKKAKAAKPPSMKAALPVQQWAAMNWCGSFSLNSLRTRPKN